MKHLNTFNDINLSKVNLKDFCEVNLAYLIDENFRIKVIKNDFLGLDIDIKKISNSRSVMFTYDEIKYDFIPFLYHLNKNYNICYINFWHYKDFTNPSFFNKRGYGQSTETIEDLIEDKISTSKMWGITISIEMKKI